MNTETLNSEWERVKERVAELPNVDGPQFNALASRLVPQAMSDGFLMLTTENSFLKSWTERSFSSAIQQALTDIYGIPFTIVVEVDNSISPTSEVSMPIGTGSVAPATSIPAPISQPQPVIENNANTVDNKTTVVSSVNPITAPMPASAAPAAPISAEAPEPAKASAVTNINDADQSHSTLSFENFVIGESNRMAYSMAVQVAELPGKTSLNPLFIYGKSGLGKTHLMRAIQNYINETQPHLRTIYADSEELISGYTDAVAEHDREKSSYKNFKTFYEAADVLLIDDIQFLQGKKQTLDIVFQIFNKLINQGKQIVLSADRAPKNIDVDERYSSRFMQGGTIDIQPPAIETKLAIVKSYINEYRATQGEDAINIPEDVQMYIAENSSSNIRELKGAVTIVIYHVNLSHADHVTIGDVSTLLENHFSGGMRKNLTVEDIQKQVEEFFKIKHSDLVSNSRSREVMYPRHIAIYLCKQLLDVPYNDIGKKFNRDHSTAMHSVAKVEEMMEKNRDVKEEIETLKQIIKEL